jgi:uncharacterized membrane protein YgdD (TMEM256/DUF423 family)
MTGWIRWGAAMMFLGVAIGAFGAHGLKNILSEPAKATFEVGVRYQLVHGLALFIVAWLASRGASSYVKASGWLFVAGIVLFSGSLYILSLTGVKAWGAVTPLGGLCFLTGWLLLGFVI